MLATKTIIAPDVFTDSEQLGKAFKHMGVAFSRQNFDGYLDKEGNLPVTVIVGSDGDWEKHYISLLDAYGELLDDFLELI